MKQIPDIPLSEQIRSEANLWAIVLTDDPDNDILKQDFAAWHAASPLHAQAWRETLHTWSLTGQTTPAFAHVSLPAESRKPLKKIHRSRMLAKSLPIALAAAACAGLWLGFPAIQTAAMADHKTAVGQNSRIVLSDGSVVTLGGHTAIAVHYSAERRNVTLLAGEALFDVRHDPRRPFQVKAGILQARDIGTRFDIRMDSTQIRVDVQDGRVGVSWQMKPSLPETRLGPGDELALDLQSGRISRTTVDPDCIGAWRDGTLVVENDTSDHVIATLRRYYPGFILTPFPERKLHRIGGLYNLHDIPAALRAVLMPAGGTVHRLGTHFMIVVPASAHDLLN
ncbi:DUF4880 domain-containing protein [Gluconobacter sp. LMG 1744]|uniref:FecR family protein n=1 Tax=Gluconobacter TaxID=441 RepID=UPI0018849F4D|nr:FecR domain-containing protein [Gluconobacter cadivus]MBF0892558.1 DUF4880 domain-containing protein [Gluconobacter cadivus]